jgi:hypothetical protein
VSVTKTLNPDDGGHTMVAYRAQDFGGGNRHIYLYDPNRTWADPASRTWYETDQNFIQINGTSWSFDHGDGIWSGDPASGGNLEMKTVTRRGEASLDRRDVVQSAGTVQTMQPRSWQNLRTTEILERVRSLGQ